MHRESGRFREAGRAPESGGTAQVARCPGRSPRRGIRPGRKDDGRAPGVRNDMRPTGAGGHPAGRDRQKAPSQPEHRRQVRRHGGPLAGDAPRGRPHPAPGRRATRVGAVPGADLGAPRRRRHTAKRPLDRLVDERGYEGSCSTARRHVRERGARPRRGRRGGGCLEPGWPPAPRTRATATSGPPWPGRGCARRRSSPARRAPTRATSPRRVAARRARVLGARPGLRLGRARPARARPRRRHRGGPPRAGRGRRVAPVLAPPRAPPHAGRHRDPHPGSGRARRGC